jgi:hypothetical protein
MDEQEHAPTSQQQAPDQAGPPTQPPIYPPTGNLPPQGKGGHSESEPTRAEKTMNRATVVIAICAFVSMAAVCIQAFEMVTGASDTSAIAGAAQQQVCAANRFADSADEINTGIGQAVIKLQAQASDMESLAKATQNANKIARDAVKLQVSAYNPYLEISDVSGHAPDTSRAGGPPANQGTSFFLTKENFSIQFYVTNSSAGEAKNIRFAVSKAYQTRGGLPAYMMAQDIQDAMSAGVPPLTEVQEIDDLEGHIKTDQPVIFTLASAADPHQMLMSEVAQWFYGEMYWDSELGSTHGWKEGFCFVIQIRTQDGGQTITPCGIHEEGVRPRKAQKEHGKK